MSDLIRPMLAKPGELPRGADWVFEMKWDGVRTIAYLDQDVRLFSRNDRDVSVSYPEFDALAAAVGTSAVLDGEIVALDEHGRPNFGILQRRMHVADRGSARRLRDEVPAIFMAFDLLRLGDTLLLDQPYQARRELLDRLDIDSPRWQTPPAFAGDGQEAIGASRAQRLEGVVAKRLGSHYRPGVRTADWVKIKNHQTQEVVIGGWREGSGRRTGSVGALLMGVPEASGLRFAGRVGTGFSDLNLTDIQRRLEPLEQDVSSFVDRLPVAESRDAHWVRPQLVGEVEYSERTADGRLRHPVWRGLRPDKAASDVVWED